MARDAGGAGGLSEDHDALDVDVELRGVVPQPKNGEALILPRR
eukprot:COSAG01_NODE_23_length_37704_cov_30.005877_37_plen_43_part_00